MQVRGPISKTESKHTEIIHTRCQDLSIFIGSTWLNHVNKQLSDSTWWLSCLHQLYRQIDKTSSVTGTLSLYRLTHRQSQRGVHQFIDYCVLWSVTSFRPDSEAIGPYRKGMHYTVNILGSSTLLKRSSTLLKMVDREPGTRQNGRIIFFFKINLDHRYHQYILINVD